MFYGMPISLMHKKMNMLQGHQSLRSKEFVCMGNDLCPFISMCMFMQQSYELGHMDGWIGFLRREQSYLWREIGFIDISIMRGTIYVY